MTNNYRPGDTVLGNWTLSKSIGEGSFGRVFEAIREEFGSSYNAAIKIITIPQSQAEIINARAEGMDNASITDYFRGMVEDIVREIALMSKLKGTANVVSYEDHAVIPHKGSMGWDIIIRMELLTPLLEYSMDKPFTRQTVTKLGIDICRALELCQRYNIVHRDIKPENIFVSELEDFKLGDFGIARTVEKTMSGLSRKGTYTYMAPEVYSGGTYGTSVDIYSLGLVLYRFLNDNRAPFLPEYPAPITHSGRELALHKRLGGDSLPMPRYADGRLAEIVLKACAYKSDERYSSPMQMRQELYAIQYGSGEARLIYPKGDFTPLRSKEYVELDAFHDDSPVQEVAGDAHKQDEVSTGNGGMYGEYAATVMLDSLFEKPLTEDYVNMDALRYSTPVQKTELKNSITDKSPASIVEKRQETPNNQENVHTRQVSRPKPPQPEHYLKQSSCIHCGAKLDFAWMQTCNSCGKWVSSSEKVIIEQRKVEDVQIKYEQRMKKQQQDKSNLKKCKHCGEAIDFIWMQTCKSCGKWL